MDNRFLYIRNTTAVVGTFRIEGKDWRLLLTLEDGTVLDEGAWATVGEADEWANLRVDEICGRERVVPEDPLAKHRAKNATLVTCIDQETGKYSVVAGYSRGFVDTGLRFNDEEAARKAVRG